jgi:hypothetical protein
MLSPSLIAAVTANLEKEDTPKIAMDKEALQPLAFRKGHGLPGTQVFRNLGDKPKFLRPRAPSSFWFYPLQGSNYYMGVHRSYQKKIEAAKGDKQRLVLASLMKAEMVAAVQKRPSPGLFLLVMKDGKKYVRIEPQMTMGMGQVKSASDDEVPAWKRVAGRAAQGAGVGMGLGGLVGAAHLAKGHPLIAMPAITALGTLGGGAVGGAFGTAEHSAKWRKARHEKARVEHESALKSNPEYRQFFEEHGLSKKADDPNAVSLPKVKGLPSIRNNGPKLTKGTKGQVPVNPFSGNWVRPTQKMAASDPLSPFDKSDFHSGSLPGIARRHGGGAARRVQALHGSRDSRITMRLMGTHGGDIKKRTTPSRTDRQLGGTHWEREFHNRAISGQPMLHKDELADLKSAIKAKRDHHAGKAQTAGALTGWYHRSSQKGFDARLGHLEKNADLEKLAASEEGRSWKETLLGAAGIGGAGILGAAGVRPIQEAAMDRVIPTLSGHSGTDEVTDAMLAKMRSKGVQVGSSLDYEDMPGWFQRAVNQSPEAKASVRQTFRDMGRQNPAFFHPLANKIVVGKGMHPAVLAHEAGHASGNRGATLLAGMAGLLGQSRLGQGVTVGVGALGAGIASRGATREDRARNYRRAQVATALSAMPLGINLLEEGRASGVAIWNAAKKGKGMEYSKVLAPAFGTYAAGALPTLGALGGLEYLRRRQLRKQPTQKMAAGTASAGDLAAAKKLLKEHGTPIAHAALGAGAILGGAHLLKRTGQAIARPYDERPADPRAQSAAIHGARGLQSALGARFG